MGSCDRSKPEDVPVIHGDIRDAEVVTELIPTGKLLKEAIEVGVA